MTASPEQFELIHKIGKFGTPPKRDDTGRIVGMEHSHGAVDIIYEAGVEEVFEVIATPEGEVISPVPTQKDFAGQQFVNVATTNPDRPMVHLTLLDPNVLLLPQDSDVPTKAVLIDRKGQTVIFEANTIKVRSLGLPEDAQD